MSTKLKIKFKPGKVVATPAFMGKVRDHRYAAQCLTNHLQGDWGLVCQEDADGNDRALTDGRRVMSVWPLPDHPDTFWIITESDRSVTTFLLPSDY